MHQILRPEEELKENPPKMNYRKTVFIVAQSTRDREDPRVPGGVEMNPTTGLQHLFQPFTTLILFSKAQDVKDT